MTSVPSVEWSVLQRIVWLSMMLVLITGFSVTWEPLLRHILCLMVFGVIRVYSSLQVSVLFLLYLLHHVFVLIQDLQDPLDPQVLKENPVLLVFEVNGDLPDPLELLDLEDPLDLKVDKDRQDPLEQLELWETWDHEDPLDPQVHQERQVPQVLQENKVYEVSQVLMDLLEYQVLLDLREPRAQLELQVLLVPPDPQESQVELERQE